MRKVVIAIVAVGIYLLSFTNAYAISLGVAQGGYQHGFNGSNWYNMTDALTDAAEGNVSVGINFEDYGSMLNFDALWIESPSPWSPQWTETAKSNLLSYIATGRRVGMIGEAAPYGSGYQAWDEMILGFVGGVYSGTYTGDGWNNISYNSVFVHQITDGAPVVSLFDGGIASGGTALYSINFATLWGQELNVLTVLDSGPFTDGHWNYANNAQFATNVADWLIGGQSAVVPEPSSLLLLSLGGLLVRRRKR